MLLRDLLLEHFGALPLEDLVVARREFPPWMRADLQTVSERVQRRDTRPLLRGRDPLQALTAMAEVRYPFYSLADVTVDVATGAHGEAVEGIIKALRTVGVETAA